MHALPICRDLAIANPVPPFKAGELRRPLFVALTIFHALRLGAQPDGLDHGIAGCGAKADPPIAGFSGPIWPESFAPIPFRAAALAAPQISVNPAAKPSASSILPIPGINTPKSMQCGIALSLPR